MDVVRAEQLSNSLERDSVAAPSPPVPTVLNGVCRMIGEKSPLPAGGKSFEDAPKISPGLYILTEPLGGNVFRYFKMNLKAGQKLVIDFRTPDTGGFAAAGIYNENGGKEISGAAGASDLKSIAWSPSTTGWVYFSVGNGGYGGNASGTVYCISLR